MSDFLDNLIDRHSDAMPQIMPRLPSLFEPEVTRGGWNAAVPDNNVPEMEETNVPPSTQIVGPTDLGAVIEPIQHKAAPAPPVPANEETTFCEGGSERARILSSPTGDISPISIFA